MTFSYVWCTFRVYIDPWPNSCWPFSSSGYQAPLSAWPTARWTGSRRAAVADPDAALRRTMPHPPPGTSLRRARSSGGLCCVVVTTETESPLGEVILISELSKGRLPFSDRVAGVQGERFLPKPVGACTACSSRTSSGLCALNATLRLLPLDVIFPEDTIDR